MNKKNLETALYVLVVLTLAVTAFNQYEIYNVSGMVGMKSVSASSPSSGSSANTVDLSQYLPKGVPAVYGPELKVSFDDAVGGLNILSAMDWDLTKEDSPNGLSMKFSDLTDEQKARYIKIGSSIACEYCCGAKTLVMKNGQPACGCSHSAAMRALTKYLLTKHGSEYTDEQILDELVKWKTLFFPKQMTAKLAQQSGKTISSSQAPDMVGGC